MLIASYNVCNDLVLKTVDEAWERLHHRLVYITVEGQVESQLSKLVRAHRVDVAALTQQQGVVGATSHLGDHGVEAADLGKVDGLVLNVRLFLAEAKLSELVASPNIDLVVRNRTLDGISREGLW